MLPGNKTGTNKVLFFRYTCSGTVVLFVLFITYFFISLFFDYFYSLCLLFVCVCVCVFTSKIDCIRASAFEQELIGRRQDPQGHMFRVELPPTPPIAFHVHTWYLFLTKKKKKKKKQKK
jgi:hypothetical protein